MMGEDKIDDNDMENIEELSANMREMSVTLALVHGVTPTHMMVAMAMAVTIMTLEYSRPGQQDAAIESLIDGIRFMRENAKEMTELNAAKEAADAKARGSIQ